MRNPRTLAGLGGLALVVSALLIPPAVAEPNRPTATGGTGGRGPDTAASVARVDRAEVIRRADAAPPVADPIEMPTSYPSQPQLRFYRDNPGDATDTAELLGHPDLAPQLTEWMKTSDRISTQVIGQSTGGRDLYLVTVTAPEREADTSQQTAWRDQIKNEPASAAADGTLLSQYKTPVWFSANIHGNEWEGTDAFMQYIEWLVTAPQTEVGSILRNNRLYFSLTLNPDGRTNATRATSLGLDGNRDMITNATPEATSFIRTAQAVQPIYSADLHGYTEVLQVEPTGPPHGSNYEYDLYLPHNYALALKVEEDVVAADIPGNTYYDVTTGDVVSENTGPDSAHIKIPYRDTPSGWDDFPPIFTAQYAAFYGAATSTVELPLSRGAPGGRQTPERARVNTAVGLETVTSMVEYMNLPANSREMLESQIEVFRRGVAGEPKTQLTTENMADVPGPEQWKPLWDIADDQEPVVLPRAYVIPTGADQRSASDASALVRQLLLHDIEVGRLTAAATVAGTRYPAGSYVVDMRQPLRGLANSLLDLGEDISPKVPFMYDISAWSLAYLWGATVDKVGLTTDEAIGATTPVTAPTARADVPRGASYLTFDVAGVADVRALNALLEDEVPASMLPDGSVLIGREGADKAREVSRTFDIDFARATGRDLAALRDDATRDLTDLSIAYAGTQDDRLSLTELGFGDLTQVAAATLNATPALLDGVDVLWVGSSLNLTEGSPGRAAVRSFVDDGGSIVGRSNHAFNVASTFGLVSGTVVPGNRSGNGIVAMETEPGSMLAPYAQNEAFIYPAYWFTGLGEGTTAVQRFGADPLLAGHWRPGTDDDDNPIADGPDDAAGQAAVITGEAASGARAVVFGTSVFFRTHPKGGMSQAARALFWAGPEGEGVQVKAPSRTKLAVQKLGSSKRVMATVTLVVPGQAPEGTVALKNRGEVVRTFGVVAADGKRSVKVRLGKGKHVLRAVLRGTAQVESSRSKRVRVTLR